MKKSKYPLTDEESDLLASFEKGEWQSVKNLKQEKLKAQKIAKNTLKKDARINIRMPSSDLMRIKKIAEDDGLPYQTLIASIIHKFISGRLVDSGKRD
ncbi:MAG: hypothetical protein A3E82_08030 [Gammaproteobacteria bacterium RIFCSPHIGHO2_12_FULL_38_11]|nr:MAG: hypothetical protein A3E82_08030 [Gammaproteobacteria bacterium RIFCSPHIGHO2_12_FULL_38_11]